MTTFSYLIKIDGLFLTHGKKDPQEVCARNKRKIGHRLQGGKGARQSFAGQKNLPV